ncbi:hypothetical protein EMIT036CA2_11116 [Chryseobacterium sp. IT-36CA2]
MMQTTFKTLQISNHPYFKLNKTIDNLNDGPPCKFTLKTVNLQHE